MEQKPPEDGLSQAYPIAAATGELSPVDPEDVREPDTPAAPATEQETFPRAYVEQLRQEAADARVKARRADDLAQQLFSARVAATGLLVDAADLPYDEQLLDDPGAMEAAIEALITAKPHLASRIPRGDIGQGVSDPADTVDLAALLRAGAN